MAECRNCGAELDGPWCKACGQKDMDLQRPFFALARDALHEALDLDGRALRSLRSLFVQPGVLTREFLAGRRRLYTPPLRLYLFISVTFFVVIGWAASRGLLLDAGQSLDEDAAEQARFLSEQLPRLMFVLLPVFALLLKAVFLSRLYFEHLIFTIHLHCAGYVVLAVMVPFESAAGETWYALLVQLLAVAYLVCYVVVAIQRVYSTGWLGAVGRAIAVLFAYLAIVSALVEATSSFLIISD